MDEYIKTKEFKPINKAYNSVFKPNKLSIGLVSPIESYTYDSIPTMENHIQNAQLAEKLGFSALWLRDIPFNVPSFGDVGQMYDPFVYLGFLAANTKNIALGVGSIILPLRHPAHVAKAAASVDSLSGGRLILGVASGDRPEEYPALNENFSNRGDRFRESFSYIKHMWEDKPFFENIYGSPNFGMDMLPKPKSGAFPMLITGASQQNPAWLAQNGDGWITYPRNAKLQGKVINSWREKAKELGIENKPVSQSLYIDLVDDANYEPEAIHLGYRTGTAYLKEHLKALEEVGVNHVALNLRFNQENIVKTLNRLAEEVLPDFK